MGDEETAFRVDGVHDTLVQRLQFCFVVHALWMSAEADEAKWCRGHALKAGGGVDLLFQQLCNADMLTDAGRDAFLSEVAYDHPEFERTETASKRIALVHEIGDLI